jgi:hypothetical protein
MALNFTDTNIVRLHIDRLGLLQAQRDEDKAYKTYLKFVGKRLIAAHVYTNTQTDAPEELLKEYLTWVEDNT